MRGSDTGHGEHYAERKYACDIGRNADGEPGLRRNQYDIKRHGYAGWQYLHVDQQRRKFSEWSEQQHGERGNGYDLHINQHASGIGMYECLGIYSDSGREYANGNADQQQRNDYV
jgi:hypothetical protein